MGKDTLKNAVAVEGSEIKNSPIDNSETGTTHNNETDTTNNYYSSNSLSSALQYQAQLDRIEQKLDFLIQRVFK